MRKITIVLSLLFLFTGCNLFAAAQILFIKDDNTTTNSLIYNDILELGYSVDVVAADLLTIESLNQHSMAILSTGSNLYACGSSNMRLGLERYMIEFNGNVIIEGGQNGYIAAVLPFYFGFRNKVMKIDGWTADIGGDLMLSDNALSSGIANNPNQLALTIPIIYSQIGDQDVCSNNKFTQILYKTSLYPDKVGVLVAPNLNNIKLINYFFNYAAIGNHTFARNLLENSIYNLIGKPVSVNNSGFNVPDQFKLYQNYPDPFNPVTKISYDLPSGNFVSIKIFNALGEEVSELVNKNQKAGSYSIEWSGSNYSTGIYFYIILVNGSIKDTKKMILLK